MLHRPDFQMSRWACSTSPPRGERWRNCSSDMAHSSLPPSSWKALPTGGSRYWCSVHRSHFCTLPGLQSTGSKRETLFQPRSLLEGTAPGGVPSALMEPPWESMFSRNGLQARQRLEGFCGGGYPRREEMRGRTQGPESKHGSGQGSLELLYLHLTWTSAPPTPPSPSKGPFGEPQRWRGQ